MKYNSESSFMSNNNSQYCVVYFEIGENSDHIFGGKSQSTDFNNI